MQAAASNSIESQASKILRCYLHICCWSIYMYIYSLICVSFVFALNNLGMRILYLICSVFCSRKLNVFSLEFFVCVVNTGEGVFVMECICYFWPSTCGRNSRMWECYLWPLTWGRNGRVWECEESQISLEQWVWLCLPPVVACDNLILGSFTWSCSMQRSATTPWPSGWKHTILERKISFVKSTTASRHT